MILRLASLLSVVIFIKLLSVSVNISHVCKYYSHYISTVWEQTSDIQEYDFIVVGSGSAGSVIANRLSKHNKVLMIEAGGTPFYANQIPVLSSSLLHTPEVDYIYKTVQQRHAAQGMIDKISYWPRGKLLGGTSNLHFMMYVRGHPKDYLNWANLTNDNSWNYENLLPYFKRSINYKGRFSSDYHYGYNYGNQNIKTFSTSPLHENLMNAGKELGFDTEIDFNADHKSGFGPVDAYQHNGERVSSYTSFIEPILNRKNLVISLYSQAIKVDLDGSNTSRGVWFQQHGKIIYARARREVIISAGSIESPKLLLLSGIGPKTDLAKIGIVPRINLPVGKNLQDHLQTTLLPFTMNGPPHFCLERDLGFHDLLEYYIKGTGFLTRPMGYFSQGFFNSDNLLKNESETWNDIQMIVAHLSPSSNLPGEFSKFLKIRLEILEKLFNSGRNDEDGFIIGVILGRPKSSGFIKLQSKDPNQHPIINPRYLSNPNDMSRLIKSIKFAFRIVEGTKAFQQLNATYCNIPIDECEMHKFKSDEYWTCYVKHISLTMYHPVGTCRMGSGPMDRQAVVDSKLRVLHTKRLRVADASIMPEIVNGNTNAPTVMIAEKAADMIREYWAEQYLVCLQHEIFFKNLRKCFYSRLA